MKKHWKKIGLGFLAVLVLFVGFVAMQPSEYTVTRSIQINSSPDKVFTQVNSLRAWDNWSPWAKLDPQAKSTFEGPAEGVGASMTWNGNDQVGEGRLTITESKPAEAITYKLEFIRPFADTAQGSITLQAQSENQTFVTWKMSGSKPFISKLFCLFMDLDKMIGTDFERGLTAMRSVAEGSKVN